LTRHLVSADGSRAVPVIPHADVTAQPLVEARPRGLARPGAKRGARTATDAAARARREGV
jgi:hypothetical protein